MTDSQIAAFDRYNSGKSADCSARNRLAALFDNGEYTEIGPGRKTADSLAAVVTAYGYIGGSPVYAFSQDARINSGAVSSAHADKICKVYELAAKNGVPVVGVYDSCGAFVDDGADALCAYGSILSRIGAVSGVVPTVSIISGICAGIMAVIAAGADFTVMTSDAQLYMTVNPKDAGSEAAAKCGLVAVRAANDREACEAARKYLSFMPQNNLSPVPEYDFAEPNKTSFDNADSSVRSIADSDSVLELYTDFGFAAYTALATIGGTAVGIAATNKNDSKLTADDCTKIARLVSICDSFSVPVVTLIDSKGFEGSDASAVRSAARLSAAYTEATCAKLAAVIGNAYGAAYISLAGPNANADVTYAFPDSVIAPVDPVTAVEFLQHDALKGAQNLDQARNALANKYAQENCSAFAAAEKGAVDDIIAPNELRARLIADLEITAGKRLSGTIPRKHSNMPM